MTVVFKYLEGNSKEDRDKVFTTTTANKTRSNGLKLKQMKFMLEIWKNLLTIKVRALEKAT